MNIEGYSPEFNEDLPLDFTVILQAAESGVESEIVDDTAKKIDEVRKKTPTEKQDDEDGGVYERDKFDPEICGVDDPKDDMFTQYSFSGKENPQENPDETTDDSELSEDEAVISGIPAVLDLKYATIPPKTADSQEEAN